MQKYYICGGCRGTRVVGAERGRGRERYVVGADKVAGTSRSHQSTDTDATWIVLCMSHRCGVLMRPPNVVPLPPKNPGAPAPLSCPMSPPA